ncbi:hypothetical protein ACE1CA_19395 [Aerosakkonemataceae cyanobacterium BLCC-F167]|uniref:Uncharacterized protein n=1 Tax=Floridaenema evergladense BLCC-F167 TaxID=3153639 RepID=A0ABV4WPP9_9CYAN
MLQKFSEPKALAPVPLYPKVAKSDRHKTNHLIVFHDNLYKVLRSYRSCQLQTQHHSASGTSFPSRYCGLLVIIDLQS